MKYLRYFLIIAVVILGIAQILLGLGAFSATASAIDSNSLMEKINRERTKRNIPALITHPRLVAAATTKTLDMFARDYFDHINPDGDYVWGVIEQAGYKPYKILGENLAIDFTSEEGIIRAWINSPSHRENMLRAEFADQGLSAQYGNFKNRYTSLVTSLFGTLVAVATAPKDSVPPAPTESPALPPAATSPPSQTNPAPPSPAPDQPPEEVSSSGNQPAVQYTPKLSQQTPPKFTTTNPADFPSEKGSNLYETVRVVFILLTVMLVFTIIVDAFRQKNNKDLWYEDIHFPPLILLLLVSALNLALMFS